MARETQKMSIHANEPGNKENVNPSPALHVKPSNNLSSFSVEYEKKLPRHENIENNKLPTSLRGKWIHMKVFLIAEAAPVTGGRCMEAK